MRLLLASCALGGLVVVATSSTAIPTGSLTLADLVTRAQYNNGQVRIERAKVEEAKSLLGVATAAAYPRLSGQAFIGGPLPEAKTAVVNDLTTLTTASLEGDFRFGQLGATFHVDATAIQPLYTFGKIASAKAAASHVASAASEKANVTEGEIIVAVHRAFWALELTRSFFASLEEGDEVLTSVIQKVEALIEDESPQVTENDRLRLVHAQKTLNVKKLEAQTASKLATLGLSILTADPTLDARSIERGSLDALPAMLDSLESLLVRSVEQRPEILALRNVVAASEAWIALKRRALFPDLFLAAFLSVTQTTNATDQTNPFIYDRFNTTDLGVAVGLRFELDVFSKLAEVRQAEAARDVRLSERALVDEAVRTEVEKLHAEWSGNRAKLEPLEQAYRAARGWLTSTVLAYDVGAGSASELIDAFLARATAEAELKKTQFELHVGFAELIRAVGGYRDKAVSRE